MLCASKRAITNGMSPTIARFCFVPIALLAGLWWIPVRTLEVMGFAGTWAIIAMSLGALPILCALAWRTPASLSKSTYVGAASIGAAVCLYSIAFTLTDVVRVMILFYLAPAWSILIEVVFWQRRFTLRDFLVLALMLLGILLINGMSLSTSSAGGAGEVLALLSGALFSVGAAFSHGVAKSTTASITFVVVASSACIGLAYVVLFDPGRPIEMVGTFVPGLTALAIGCLFMAPVMFGTVWAAKLLSPSALTSLLTLEIVSGVASGALFSGQKFGGYELAGSTTIIIAVIISSLKIRRRASY